MARKRESTAVDILVLGAHASAFVASAMLARAGLRVSHGVTASESAVPDRLTLLNPATFALDELLSPLKRKLAATALYGLRLVPNDGTSAMKYVSRAAAALTVSVRNLREELTRVSEREGVKLSTVTTAEAVSANESGVSLMLDGKLVSARMLVLADALPTHARTVLHVNAAFDADASHRYTWITCKGNKLLTPTPKAGLVMSMDLAGELMPAWLIPGDGCYQLAVAQPLTNVRKHDPATLLRKWADQLLADGAITAGFGFKASQVHEITLPFTGALSGEGVANRTLLIGPAGGFVSSTGEDVYPGCWSAVVAVDVIVKAVKETHLQDALNPFRTKWRITLGEYLRGPQQNLRHLLPLVYRNEVMTARLAEAIFEGKMMVR